MFAAVAGSPNLMLHATIFLGAALLFVPLGKRFGIATVLGYLITGLIPVSYTHLTLPTTILV